MRNWRCSPCCLIPLLAYVAYRLGSIYRPLSLDLQHQLAEMTTVLEQNPARRQNRQAFAQEDAEVDRFEAEKQQVFRLAQQQVKVTTQLSRCWISWPASAQSRSSGSAAAW